MLMNCFTDTVVRLIFEHEIRVGLCTSANSIASKRPATMCGVFTRLTLLCWLNLPGKPSSPDVGSGVSPSRGPEATAYQQYSLNATPGA